jgi:chorismate mutase
MSATIEDSSSPGGPRGPEQAGAATSGDAHDRVQSIDDKVTADSHIAGLRSRIDEIDAALIQLWQERAAISREVGKTRIASGGTRLVLSREREILDRFRTALGADGTQLALLILRAGRGPL